MVQTKSQAAPGLAPERDAVTGELVLVGGVLQWAHATSRWVGSGRVIVDHKGNVVRQYEPFFSSLSDYEDEVEVVQWGVAAQFTHDPIGRNTRVDLPDGNARAWSYSPWEVSAFDEEDLLTGGTHENTPTTTHLDALGRAYKLERMPDGATTLTTRLTLDLQGNLREVEDARANTVQVQRFDVLGRPCFTGAADEGYDGVSGDGERRTLVGADSQALRVWRSGSVRLKVDSWGRGRSWGYLPWFRAEGRRGRQASLASSIKEARM